MQKRMMSCHLIPMWHEWNVNTADVMITWFTLYANLVTLHLVCVTCTCVHGTCALCKTTMSKYPSDLVCMQGGLNLERITSSHFMVLNT